MPSKFAFEIYPKVKIRRFFRREREGGFRVCFLLSNILKIVLLLWLVSRWLASWISMPCCFIRGVLLHLCNS